MTEPTGRLSTALADGYRIERHLGEGQGITAVIAKKIQVPTYGHPKWLLM